IMYNNNLALHSSPTRRIPISLPVADRIVDEIQLRNTAKVSDGENRVKYRLKPDILSLRRQQVHLQKPLIRLPLYFDQVRDVDDCGYFGEINALTHSAIIGVSHSVCSLLKIS